MAGEFLLSAANALDANALIAVDQQGHAIIGLSNEVKSAEQGQSPRAGARVHEARRAKDQGVSLSIPHRRTFSHHFDSSWDGTIWGCGGCVKAGSRVGIFEILI